MKSISATFLCFGLMLPLADFSSAKGWRGIVPLHSTRADVERLLGPAKNECKCGYYLDDVNVFIVYSRGDCKNGRSAGWDVPPDTVIRITVSPKQKLQLSELKIDETKFEKKQDPEIESIMHYINEEEGFSIEVNQGLVQEYYYQPAAKDEPLRCR